jgi:hypothetical protein
MLSKYSKTTDAFIEASKHPDSSITLPTNVRSFNATAEAASKCLEDVNVCVKELQTRLFSLAQCRQIVDSLITATENGYDDPNSHWYQHHFPTHYIGPNSKKQPNIHFHNGVIKLKNKQPDQLTKNERDALKSLKNECDTTEGNVVNVGSSFAELVPATKKQKVSGTWKNVDFIQGDNCSFYELFFVQN